jgi:hypothetical protein
MAKKNSIDNFTQDLTVDPGASGDSFIQFDINGTGEFRLGVDDTDDSFRISQGSALGTNDTFVMTDAGERTMPLQPAFLAYQASQATNVTGGATDYFIGTTVALTEVFDQNADFNTNGTFTAPITGRYAFYMWITLSGITASANDMNLEFVSSNRGYISMACEPSNTRNTSGVYGAAFSVFADMDAADTCRYKVVVVGAGNVVDVDGSADAETAVAGYLVC